jgi:hypothetical protein
MRFSFFLLKRLPGESQVNQHGRLKVVIGFVALVLMLAALTANAFRSKRPIPIAKTSVASSSPQTAVVERGSRRSDVEALPITLKRGGFVPGEIIRPTGHYFLSVTNFSGVGDVLLRLDREGRERLHERRVQRENPSWRQNMHLTPGTYLLTEANHPEWVCRLTITAR